MKNRILIICFIVVYFSSNSQVVINEVMHKPATSSSVNQGLIKKEYVEIYNPTCSPIDISCWILGSSAPLTGSTPYWVGAFQFPSGTVINPGQHLVIGGTNSDNGTAYNAADIDFLVQGNPNTCIAGTGGWLLPNGDGWVALYNSSGIVEDAIYWSLSANPNLTTDLDFSTNPCVPSTSCSPIASLMSCRQIFQNYPTKLSYGGLSTSFDLTFSRVPDGGSWQRDVPSSITGSQCNNGVCNTPSTFNLNAAVSQPNCSAADGSITFNPTPSGTYNYTWSPAASSSNSANNLSAGSYNITITNATGCQKDTMITLTSIAGITNANITVIDANCNQSNGSVEIVSVTGGTSPYTYNFNNNGFSSNNLYQNIAGGTYNLIIEDGNGCQYTPNNIIVNNGNGPTAVTINQTDENCNQMDGSVQIVGVTGGTAPYQYDFNHFGFSSTTNFSNLQNGTYTLSVQDNNGCLFNAPDVLINNIGGPNQANIAQTNPACGLSNGTIIVSNIIGGTAPYQVNFNALGSSTNLSYSNLSAGTYTIEIIDQNGCSYNAPNVTLNDVTGPTNASANITDASCNLNNGSIQINNVIGGTQPYQFAINNGAFTSNNLFNVLGGGTYNITVKDANGCTYDLTNLTVNSTVGITAIDLSTQNATCGQQNGLLNINGVIGGSAPYTFSINNGAFSSNTNYNGLQNGNYTIQVIDNNGCQFNSSFQIQGGISPTANFNIYPGTVNSLEADNIQLLNTSSNDVTNWEWFMPDASPSQSNEENPVTSFSGLEAGLYPVLLLVTNSSGCTDTITKYIEITENIIVFAPNSFTPDKDEFNDTWQVYLNNVDLSFFELSIYNRWGEILFFSENSAIGWDGTYNNKICPDGTYTWVLNLKDQSNDAKYSFKGHINLIR